MADNPLLTHYERLYGPFVHMAPNDKAIWLRYLMMGGAQLAPFQYDVRVGTGVQMPSGSSPMELNIAHALTTKRIDALCHVDGKVRIIEVKQRAGLSAIGQLIGYGQLFVKTFPQSPPYELWLVTDQLQPDMSGVLIENNIHYVEVGL